MLKRSLVYAAVLLFAGSLAMVPVNAAGTQGTWSGVVTDNMCGAKGASASQAACTKKCVSDHGAKLALYDAADKKVYVLEPQEKATGHEGHSVTIKGTLDGDTIHVESLTMNAAK